MKICQYFIFKFDDMLYTDIKSKFSCKFLPQIRLDSKVKWSHSKVKFKDRATVLSTRASALFYFCISDFIMERIYDEY